MTIYYCDQILPNATAGGTLIPYVTRNTIPVPVDGDTVLFAVGKYWKNTNPGVSVYIFDFRNINVTVGSYIPATGVESVNQPDPGLYRAADIWMPDEVANANFAILSGELTQNNNPANYTNSRGVNMGGKAGVYAILRGVIIEQCQQCCVEYSTAAGLLLMDKCYLRNFGANLATFGGNGFRSTSVNQFTIRNSWILNNSEDAVWAGVNTQGAFFQNSWIKTWSLPPLLNSANHTDAIQMNTGSLPVTLDRMYIDHRLPETLAGDGLPWIGTCLLSGGNGSTIMDCIFRDNVSGLNCSQSNMIILRNRFYFYNNPATTAANGFMDPQITLGAGGGHVIKNNLWVINDGVQSGSNGFQFAILNGMFANSIIENNTFVSRTGRVAKNGGAMNFGASTSTAIWRNNLWIGFERALVVNTTPAVENGNAFCECQLRVTVNQTGGGETGLGANDLTVARTAFYPESYTPMQGSPLINAGIHSVYKLDPNKNEMHNPPTIGAYEPAS